jgi:hypothetical protein
MFDSPELLSVLPCNLFVRREAFDRAGGYSVEYFDLRLGGIYFREDADFGFRLLDLALQIVRAPRAVVTHPPQFREALSPWRHVRRYYFDPLLARNHPRRYRERIEVKQITGVRVRRPFHYACLVNIASWLIAAGALAAHDYLTVTLAGMILLGTVFILQYRYTHRWVPGVTDAARFIAFLSLPFYYWYWHVRGCRRFHSWKTVL